MKRSILLLRFLLQSTFKYLLLISFIIIVSGCAAPGEYIEFEYKNTTIRSRRQSGLVSKKEFYNTSKGYEVFYGEEIYSLYPKRWEFTNLFIPENKITEKGTYFNPNNYLFISIPALVGGAIYLSTYVQSLE